MPVPDETNNFATHGKAPIPSNANGSFVVPHNKEPEIKSPAKPAPVAAVPPVVTAPPAADPTAIVAPPAGAAFISAPPANASMSPAAGQAPVLSVSPLAPPPMAQQPIQQQPMMPLAIPQQMPMQQQPMPMQMPMPPQVPQQIIPSEPSQIIPSNPQGDGIPMPLPQPQPQMQPMPMQMQSPQMQQQQMMQQMQQQMQQMEMQMQQMQQLQQQQQMMPAQMPMQPQMQPMPMQMPMPQVTPIQPATPQYSMTPARIADMQAEILAKALISSQTSGIRPRQKQTYKKSEPEPEPDYEEPTQQDIRDNVPVTKTPSNITHGERIILPIHDMTLEQHREDMNRRMTELLGDEEEFEPEVISTKSMKKKQKELAKMKVRNATQASEDIQMTPEQQAQAQAAAAAQARQQASYQPTPAELFPEYTLSGEAIAPQDPLIDPLNNPKRYPTPPPQELPTDQPPQVYTLETQELPVPTTSAEEQQNFVEQEYRPQTPQSSYDITSQMQDVQLPTLESDQEARSMDPRIAAIQQQQLMQMEQQKQQEEQKARAAAQQQAAQQQAAQQQAAQLQAQQQAHPQVQSQSGRLNPNRKSIRVNPDVVKKAALASILKRATPEPEPEPEPVEAIRPAYVEELEEQLAGDMKESDSELDTLMAAELADDEITANAKQVAAEKQAEAKKQAAAGPVVPDEVMKAIGSAAPVNEANPNIGSPNIQDADFEDAGK